MKVYYLINCMNIDNINIYFIYLIQDLSNQHFSHFLLSSFAVHYGIVFSMSVCNTALKSG